MMMLLAALRESAVGTKRTNGTGLTMSGLEGKADFPRLKCASIYLATEGEHEVRCQGARRHTPPGR